MPDATEPVSSPRAVPETIIGQLCVGENLATGQVLLGRYEIRRVLGRGAMGEVVEVHDQQSGNSYAVKHIPPDLVRDETQMREMRDNFALVSQLTHPHIATTRHMETDPATGHAYFLMDLVRGTDLAKWLLQQRIDQCLKQGLSPDSAARTAVPLSINVALGIAEQIADALDYAHSQPISSSMDGKVKRYGILHRDLKPANVMIESDREYRPGVPYVKLVDFGLAAVIQASLQSLSVRQVERQISGTPAYMAPEQWEGRTLTSGVDQWALAVIIYEMVAGQRPFQGSNATALCFNICRAAPEAPPALTEAQWAVFQQSFQLDRRHRHPSCMAFIKALAESDPKTAGSVLAAQMPMPGETLNGIQVPESKHRKFALAAALLGLLVIAGLAWWGKLHGYFNSKAQDSAPAVVAAAIPPAAGKPDEVLEARVSKLETEKARKEREEEERAKIEAEVRAKHEAEDRAKAYAEDRKKHEETSGVKREEAPLARIRQLWQQRRHREAADSAAEMNQRWTGASQAEQYELVSYIKEADFREALPAARTLLAEKRPEKAQALLGAAAHLGAEVGRLRAQTGRLFADDLEQTLGDIKDEMARAEEALKKYAEAMKKGWAALDAARVVEARACFQEALDAKKDDALAAEGLKKAERLEAAKLDLDKATKAAARSLERGDPQRAVETIEDALAVTEDAKALPEYDATQQRLQAAKEAVAQKKAEGALDKALADADDLGHKADLAGAVTVLAKALDANERFVPQNCGAAKAAWEKARLAQLKDERLRAAEDKLKRALAQAKDVQSLEARIQVLSQAVADAGELKPASYEAGFAALKTANEAKRAQELAEAARQRLAAAATVASQYLEQKKSESAAFVLDEALKEFSASKLSPESEASLSADRDSVQQLLDMAKKRTQEDEDRLTREGEARDLLWEAAAFLLGKEADPDGIFHLTQDENKAVTVKFTQALERNPDFAQAKDLQKRLGVPRDLTLPLGIVNGNGVTMDFVLILKGRFEMGSRHGDERPPHKVRIQDHFYLSTYEVTQNQWEALMGTRPAKNKSGLNPVENISWEDAQRFIGKLKAKLPTWEFALPTEAQWEYASRAGGTGAYSFGDDAVQLEGYAWFKRTSLKTTHKVGTSKPNAWGLYDMYGNVAEWCNDFYGKNYYEKSPEVEPRGPDTGDSRVVRGGAYDSGADDCRASVRDELGAKEQSERVGFRVAVLLKGQR